VNDKPPVVLDDIDKAIIRELQLDGRTPYAKLGPAVGLSQAAVRQRVQRLIENGVMQVVAVTDPLMLGFKLEALIGVEVDGDLRAVASKLAEVDNVDYVVVTRAASTWWSRS
jgi:Lrp/AsnC family transcriptional regulator for asnA, asnC and gidA